MASYQHASYSLADYILTIKCNGDLQSQLGWLTDSYSIGGQGQFLGDLSVELSTAQWSTEADATGAWVHSKTFDQHGTISLRLNQMAEATYKLINALMAYYSSTEIKDGFTITLTKTGDADFAVEAEDCRITQLPAQDFQDAAQEQAWSFTCGRITVNAKGAN